MKKNQVDGCQKILQAKIIEWGTKKALRVNLINKGRARCVKTRYVRGR